MDETADNAWLNARLGNAIDVWVDRTLNRPQLGYDPAQAYGMDANGNLYQLGQTNSQVVAQVNSTKGGNNNLLLLVLIVGAIVMVAK
ncbi:hypothetical protein [Duganella radicis]|uniref:Uncharacterized protein n=1 Tax=Duganella radicis TaxID=551988 RepID=A0A6L6PB50_9BURK|nr:hypothetical protein [Duganella radicis]MTV36278.1 hypothetical protein [Duganella radicis]